MKFHQHSPESTGDIALKHNLTNQGQITQKFGITEVHFHAKVNLIIHFINL